MIAPEAVLDEVAGAILDGVPVDWATLESGADLPDKEVVEQLRLLASLKAASGAADTRTDGAPEQWGHLRVLERIGRGAYGQVFRAWDTRLAREVALKLLPVQSTAAASHTSAIIEEGRLLARIRHPNVVTIYGAERIERQIGLWMEFIKGRTLEELLREGKVFTVEEMARIGVELCSAVSAVHAAGLLHRDIKTENVMVADDGRVVLMDFGAGWESRSRTQTTAGTPLYLAPEVLSGAAPTHQSDIYSIGVLLYHLLTNSYPVQARALDELRRAHERGERTNVRSTRRDVPLRLARVIERALDPLPERRHATADALAADLASLEGSSPLRRLAYATSIAFALLAIVWIGWELRARSLGHRSPSGALFAGAVLPGSEAPVIAVLPFKNLSAEPDSDYFVDGLTDEIIRNLAVIDGLQVRSQTSSFFFKDRPRNLRDIGEQLRTNLVVEGSVQRDGRRLRVNAQLVRVAGDVPLWSERFDRPLEDVFAIQDEISRAIVNRLRLTLGRGQRRYQTNVGAYELYLRGRSLIGRRSAQNAQQAATLFDQVIARDPAFAPAYAGLVDAYAFMSTEIGRGISFHEALARMRPAADRALELDPLLAEAHAAMGMTYSREREWQNAQKSFRRAIELNPTLTQIQTNYSISTLMPLGRVEEAEQLLTRALEIDPLSLTVRRDLALLQIVAGRYNDAIENLERVRAADPALPVAQLFLARALTFAGRLDEAWAAWGTHAEPGWEFWKAHAYVQSGQRAEVERMLARHDHPFRRAVIHAALGDKDRTFEELNRAADILPHRVANLLVYPEMALLRGDPRLDALRKKLKLP